MKNIIVDKLKLLLLLLAMSVFFVTIVIHTSRLGTRNPPEYKIANMGRYYERLDEESQRHISNNVFSVVYVVAGHERRSVAAFSGTCWSFYWDENYWYLMTNYHVISEIVERTRGLKAGLEGELQFLRKTSVVHGGDLFTAPQTVQQINSGEFLVPGRMLLKNVAANGRSLHVTIEKSVIIYDRFCEKADPESWTLNPNHENLFADIDELTTKRYQLDMAMIRLAFSDITISETTADGRSISHDANWVRANTYNFALEFNRYIKDVPVTLNGNGKNRPIYYLSGYPSGDKNVPVFSDCIFEGSWTHKTFPYIYNPKRNLPSSVFNCWTFNRPFIVSSPSQTPVGGWTLNSGASGSPLFELEKYKDKNLYRIKQKTPVAIFWGGFIPGHEDSKLFLPAFNLFRSERYDRLVKEYNVFKNCWSFLRLDHQSLPTPSE